jgi:FkbM family methyltransferase
MSYLRGESEVKEQIKNVIRGTIRSVVNLGSGTRIGNFMLKQLLINAMEEIREVSHDGITLRFAAPNTLCDWRAKTFSTKEPETLEWIDSIPKNSILWDVGANIGLYSVYAAKKRNCKVWAFEPSVFNLELLARNIFNNGLAEQVCIVPVALSDQSGASQMRMTTTEWGGALSTFGQDFGWDGKKIRQVFEFRTLGLSMDNAAQRLVIPLPDYIKMDVDGLEHMILKGGPEVLKQIKGILIEVNDDFHEQSDQCQSLLTDAGLILKEKRHSDMIAGSTTGFQNSFNQIWARP